MKARIKIDGIENGVTKGHNPGHMTPDSVYLDGADFGEVGQTVEVPEFRVVGPCDANYQSLHEQFCA